MSTPQGPSPHPQQGNPDEQPAEQPTWGTPPPGGWGQSATEAIPQTSEAKKDAEAEADRTQAIDPRVWAQKSGESVDDEPTTQKPLPMPQAAQAWSQQLDEATTQAVKPGEAQAAQQAGEAATTTRAPWSHQQAQQQAAQPPAAQPTTAQPSWQQPAGEPHAAQQQRGQQQASQQQASQWGQQQAGQQQWGQQGAQPQWGQQPQAEQQWGAQQYGQQPYGAQQPTAQWAGQQQAWGSQQGQQQAWGQQAAQQPAQWGAQPQQAQPQQAQPRQAPQQAWSPSQAPGQGQAQGTGQGQSYPPLPEQSGSESRSKTPLILGAVGLLVVVLIGVLGFWTPGWFVTRVFDTAAVQAGVQKVLTENYGMKVTAVKCGQDIQVTAGAQFQCDATVDGGQVKIPIRVTSASGDYEVGRPL